jgi:hypothetical protein
MNECKNPHDGMFTVPYVLPKETLHNIQCLRKQSNDIISKSYNLQYMDTNTVATSRCVGRDKDLA